MRCKTARKCLCGLRLQADWRHHPWRTDDDGSLGKIGLHALMGGLAAEAVGGDFRTGAWLRSQRGAGG